MSNSVEPVLEVLELILSSDGKNGADDEIEPEYWIPVAICLCWFAAMKTCESSGNDQCRYLKVGVIEEQGGAQTKGGEVHRSEHDALKFKVPKEVDRQRSRSRMAETLYERRNQISQDPSARAS